MMLVWKTAEQNKSELQNSVSCLKQGNEMSNVLIHSPPEILP